jgi:hypothetical protein
MNISQTANGGAQKLQTKVRRTGLTSFMTLPEKN